MNNLHIFYYNLIEFLSHKNRCKLGILSKDIYQLTNRNGFYEYITYNPLEVKNSNIKKKYEKHRNTIILAPLTSFFWVRNKRNECFIRFAH